MRYCFEVDASVMTQEPWKSGTDCVDLTQAGLIDNVAYWRANRRMRALGWRVVVLARWLSFLDMSDSAMRKSQDVMTRHRTHVLGHHRFARVHQKFVWCLDDQTNW